VTEPTDETVMALWCLLPSEVQDGRELDDIRPWVAAVLDAAQPFAKAGPGEDACGKAHPDGRHTCQRRARHDVCVSWESGNGSDAWVVDYDNLVGQIEQLRAEIEVAKRARILAAKQLRDALNGTAP
jgi:hypothetical protein